MTGSSAISARPMRCAATATRWKSCAPTSMATAACSARRIEQCLFDGCRQGGVAARQLDLGCGRQVDGEPAALADGAVDVEHATVPVDDVLDDREPQPGRSEEHTSELQSL